MKSRVEVAYVELKAPKDSSSQSKYVEDMWSLASEAHDMLSLHLRRKSLIRTFPYVQIFGHKMKLFKMEYVGGLYVWTEVGMAYLPRDHQDLDILPKVLSLCGKFKSMLDTIELDPYLRHSQLVIPEENLQDDSATTASECESLQATVFPSTPSIALRRQGSKQQTLDSVPF
ncbi:MAG: hypothetical protein J3Q66DRAFT_201600 [Benniella sp.]|nr:MAG: hypothetical protein J3Q66DRAFT_201600 [Benniella sp.]